MVYHTSYGFNWLPRNKTWRDKIPANEFMISQQSAKTGHTFTSATKEDILKLIKKNRGLYEVFLTRDYPRKLYADIDFKNPPTDFNQEEYLEKLIGTFREYIPNVEFAISGSVRDDKASYHLVSTNYTIDNEEQMSNIKALYTYIKQNVNDAFDPIPMNSYNEFKFVGQSKPTKPVQAPITHKDDIEAHLVLHGITDKFKSIPQFSNLPKKARTAIKKIKTARADDTPIMDLPVPEDLDWEALIKPENATQLLHYIPADVPTDGHIHRVKICNYCINNNVSKSHFLKWISQVKDGKDRKEKYSYIWDYQSKQTGNVKLTQAWARKYLLKFYKNLNPSDVNYEKFLKQMNPVEDASTQHKIEDKLSGRTFDDLKYKFISLAYPMGFGKTEAIMDWLLSHPEKTFCYIVPRITLAEDIYTRMTNRGIRVSLYKDIGHNKTEKAELLCKSSVCRNIIICLNSIHHLINRDEEFNYLLFDEVETTMSAFVGSGIDKLGKEFIRPVIKQKCLSVIQQNIQSAEKVIALDAFLTQRYINFCKAIDPEMDRMLRVKKKDGEVVLTARRKHIILNATPKEEPIRNVVQLKTNVDGVLRQIANDICEGKKVFVFYPFKTGNKQNRSMDTTMEIIAYLVREKGVFPTFERGVDYQAYNSETDDKIRKEIGNVNEMWLDYQMVMCNNTITAGVSYVANNPFDSVYLMIAPFNNARDIAQVSMRCRQLVSKTIYIKYLGGETKDMFEDDTQLMNMSFYTQMYNDSIIEFLCPLKRAVELFFQKANFDVSQSAIQTEKEEALKDILENIELGMGEYEWDIIPDIEEVEGRELIKRHMTYADATTMERYMLRKLAFRKEFKDDADPNGMKYLWNEGLLKLVKEARNAKEDPASFENILSKANEWSFFPDFDYGRADKIKIDFPQEAREKIFMEWKGRFGNETNEIVRLLKSVYNSKYGQTIIKQVKVLGRVYYGSGERVGEFDNIVSNAIDWIVPEEKVEEIKFAEEVEEPKKEEKRTSKDIRNMIKKGGKGDME